MSEVVGESEEAEGAAAAAEEVTEDVARATGITAGVVVLFLLLRLLAVSDWNWDTGAEVLESINVDDSISILFGTLFAVPALTAIMVAVLLPLAASDLIRLHRQGEPSLGKYVLLVALIVTAAALIKTFHFWWLPLGVLAVGLIIVIHEMMKRRGRGRNVVTVAVRRVGLMALIALLVMAAVVRTPWTPEEKIVTNSGTVVGYVLEAESGYLKVLTSEDRKLKILLTSDVESRTPLD